MPIYSRKDGVGQELLMMINGRNYSEFFVGHEKLRLGQADLQILISSERLLVFSVTNPTVSNNSNSTSVSNNSDETFDMFAKNVRPVLTIHHSELVCARMVTSRDLVPSSSSAISEDGAGSTSGGQEGEKFYVELVLKMSSRFIYSIAIYLFDFYFYTKDFLLNRL
jgi:hypothetical protein